MGASVTQRAAGPNSFLAPPQLRLEFVTAMPHISRMQKDSKLFEDLGRVASGAAGAFMDMRREVEAMVSDKLERLISRDKFVTREEFEVVKAMAQKAREENEALKAALDKLAK